MQAQVYSLKGGVWEKATLPKRIFGVKVAPALLAQAVRAYLGNRRAASAKTKSRGMVAGSTRKIFRQKGTGRARHGAIRAPIFVGGGISHGPDGEQNYKLDMPKRMGRLALSGVLVAKAAAKEVALLTGTEKADGRTRAARRLREKMGMAEDKTLVVWGEKEANVDRGWRNLDGVTLVHPNNLNVHTVLTHKKIVFTQTALGELEKIYAS